MNKQKKKKSVITRTRILTTIYTIRFLFVYHLEMATQSKRPRPLQRKRPSLQITACATNLTVYVSFAILNARRIAGETTETLFGSSLAVPFLITTSDRAIILFSTQTKHITPSLPIYNFLHLNTYI